MGGSGSGGVHGGPPALGPAGRRGPGLAGTALRVGLKQLGRLVWGSLLCRTEDAYRRLRLAAAVDRGQPRASGQVDQLGGELGEQSRPVAIRAHVSDGGLPFGVGQLVPENVESSSASTSARLRSDSLRLARSHQKTWDA